VTEQQPEETVVVEETVVEETTYEPDCTTEPEREELAPEGEEDPNLPEGDSGEFDGATLNDDEEPGEAQPDEPMTREEPSE
jgi:hypothetical protein